MSDSISGIRTIRPTYPVKPTQPSEKDRESGKRRKDRPLPSSTDESEDADNGDKPQIDEYI